MKHMKKLMASLLVAVLALALGSAVALAADGDFMESPETTISATDVVAGDSVQYFKLVGLNATTGNWELTTLGASCGVSLENLIDGITDIEAATIAKNVTSGGTAMTPGDPATTFTADVAPGLYYLKATPAQGNKDTVYNPAFVSADYYEGGNTISFNETIGSSAVVKKSTVPFDKEVNDTTDNWVDVKPGDVIPFKVTTTIPSYGASFEHPQFKVEDTLSAGLQLEGDVSVTYGEETVTASNDDVTITPSTSGFTVQFSEDYLTGLNGDTPSVEITYSAKVTTDGANNVTYMDNKAKLTFSNTPTETVNKEDITRHYTFAIDGSLLGGSSEETSELIKTGVDANGDPVTEEQTYYNEKEAGPLAGASFQLVSQDGSVTKTAESDANGRINFDGLDAGVYTLTEVSAPAGFVKDSRTFTVTITPTYDTDTPDLLVSYEITITAPASGDTPAYSGGATFTMDNTGPTMTSSHGTDTSFIENKQGQELPSTGGMGTTILYIAGAIMVLLAGVYLISKRRASRED